MRNTLIAAGPRLRQGSVSEIPCGIVDIAPTLLHCLGLPVPEGWQGRVLSEALRKGVAAPVWSLEQRTADFAVGRQELSLAHAGGVTYTAGARIQRG